MRKKLLYKGITQHSTKYAKLAKCYETRKTFDLRWFWIYHKYFPYFYGTVTSLFTTEDEDLVYVQRKCEIFPYSG